jgi:eukaryotic-like serine/threonine-protein kinase
MKVLNEINRGGFGRVERVLLDDGRIVAKKTFDPHFNVVSSSDIPKLKQRFQREVRVQSSLGNESFIEILDYDLETESPWFTMPLADKNFGEEIQKYRSNNSIPLTALSDILNALEELHRLGYVHRDLKPQNILFHNNRWKLSDFGLVLSTTGTTTKLTGSISKLQKYINLARIRDCHIHRSYDTRR